MFLSLRRSAERFGVPVSTMADIYRRLGQEGIITAVRGSRTMLCGRGGERTLRVRGVIGMPLSLTRLTALRDYRRCFTHLRDALHRRGFMVSPIFFEQSEAEPAALVQRLKRENVDAALWLLPDGAARGTASWLRDAGIPFLGVDLSGVGGAGVRFELRREPALRAILRNWRTDPQLEEVVIVRAGGEATGDVDRLPKIVAIVEAEGFRCRTTMLPPRGVTRFLMSLCEGGKQAMILPGPAAAVLAWRGSAAADEVLARCRVALVDGPMELLRTPGLNAPQVDIVTADWRPIAEEIAEEIVSGRSSEEEKTTVFNARHRLRVPAAAEPEEP